MNKELEAKKKVTEEFFKDAFRAESAEQLLNERLSNFTETGIIKIITGGKRGGFYVALLRRI